MDGPYRATKIWNEMLCTFKSGMPLKKHRRHMRVYESCFTGEEAVHWLQTALKDNPNIKPGVNKHQVRQLLGKYLKAGVFSAVCGSGGNHEFKENELYRFTGHRVSVLATSEMGRKGFETAPTDLSHLLSTYPVENREPFYDIANCGNSKENTYTLKKEATSSALGSKPYSAEESCSCSGRLPAKPNTHEYDTGRKPVSSRTSNVSYPVSHVQNQTNCSNSQKSIEPHVYSGCLRNRYDVTQTVGSMIDQKHEAQRCLRNLPSACAPTEKHVHLYVKPHRSPSYEFACHKVKNAQLGIPQYDQENVTIPNLVYYGTENKRNVMTSNGTSQYCSVVAPVKPPRLHNYTDGNRENLPPKPSKSEHGLHDTRGNYPSNSCRRNSALKTTADKSSQFPPSTSDLEFKCSFDGKCLTQRSHAIREVPCVHTSSGYTSGSTGNCNTLGYVYSALCSAFMLRMENVLSGSGEIVDLLPKHFRIDWLIRNVLDQSGKIERSECVDRPEDLLSNFHEELGITEPLIQMELNSVIIETFLFMEHINTATKQYVCKAGKTVPATTSVEKPLTVMACPTIPNNELWNTNQKQRILPESFCFETAFASDTPVTRIIPQCAVDSIHLTRHVSKSFRCPREKSSSSRARINEAGVLKRNASESHVSSMSDSAAAVRRSKSSQDVKELEDEYVVMGDLNRPVQPQEKGQSRRHRPWRLSKKRIYTESKEKNCGLQHCRNMSGGYVNPALSQSLEDLTQSQNSQEYDNSIALESLKDMMKYTREDTTDGSSSECSSFFTASSSTSDLQKISEASLNKQNDLTQWTQPALALGMTVYQLVLLLLPPSNRSSLGRLLRCLHNLPTAMDVKESFQVIQSMTPKVLAYNDGIDETLAFRIVKFLVLFYKEVLMVPLDFYEEVLGYSPQLQHLQMSYCDQVTREQFTEQGVTSSQKALSELLVQIVNDLRMGEKEKKRKLKMFQDRYPDIYRKHFPDMDEIAAVADKSHGILQLPSFGKPSGD